jgi:GTPase
LEEVKEADVILHVRDISSDETAAQAQDVRTVLSRLGIEMDGRRLIEVWNKVDLLPEEAREEVESEARRTLNQAVAVSAVTGEGCDALLQAIAQLVDESSPIEIHAPASEGAAIAWLYRHGRVIDRETEADGGTRMAVRLSDQAMGQFEQLFPKAALTLH